MHMWCPDVIGREVWEWVGRESESWLAMISPPKGGRSPHRGVSTDWVERVGPGLRLLLLYVIVSLYILLLAGTYHSPSSFFLYCVPKTQLSKKTDGAHKPGCSFFSRISSANPHFADLFFSFSRRKLATTTLQQQHQQQHVRGHQNHPFPVLLHQSSKKRFPSTV